MRNLPSRMVRISSTRSTSSMVRRQASESRNPVDDQEREEGDVGPGTKSLARQAGALPVVAAPRSPHHCRCEAAGGGGARGQGVRPAGPRWQGRQQRGSRANCLMAERRRAACAGSLECEDSAHCTARSIVKEPLDVRFGLHNGQRQAAAIAATRDLEAQPAAVDQVLVNQSRRSSEVSSSDLLRPRESRFAERRQIQLGVDYAVVSRLRCPKKSATSLRLVPRRTRRLATV